MLVAAAMTAALAVPSLAPAASAPTERPAFEKCYGIAANGQNDCATETHSCGGRSTKANDPQEWIYVPAGTCQKIQGGSLTPKSA